MPKIPPAMKECSRGEECANPSGAEQTLERFRRDPGCSDGLKTICRYCENKDRRARRAVPSVAEAQSLLPWARDIERAVVEALIQYGGLAEAAESLGLTVVACRGALGELKRRAARAGWAPEADMDRPTADGFHVKGVSTYYRVEPDGSKSVVGQWVKTRIDEEHRLEQLADAMQGILDPVRGGLAPVPAATAFTNDLLCVYPMGDPHFGMHAWGEEVGGADFNLKLAESHLVTAVEHLVSIAPPAQTALILNLGDFFHVDNLQGVTARSGHRLDVDTRLPKVHRVGLRAMRASIDAALRKHERVIVWCKIGNHDDLTSTMLALCLRAMYEREPRVHVEDSPDVFTYHRFGKCLIASCHGNGLKPDKLGSLLATDRPKDWGETVHRMWYTGHVHHDRAIEVPGCMVEAFRTLAPRDQWAHAAGYRSGQDMKCDVWHAEHGLVSRNVIGIRQVAALAALREGSGS